MATTIYKYCLRWLGSRWFLLLIILLFVLQASQLVLTSAYPMAFDEGYHLEVIRFFSHHWQPFIASQPPDTYAQGAIVHNPSFLYHFLLSFPYRLVAAFTDSLAVQVIALRFINVGLAVGTLLVLRRLFGLMRVAPLLANITLFILALTPMFTALSAQINYDNAVILLAAVAGYFAVRLLTAPRLRADTLVLLMAVALLGCVVKFSFLPILCAVLLGAVWTIVARVRRSSPQAVEQEFWQGVRGLSRRRLVGLAGLAVVSVGLFASFYGYAVVRYHNPVPQCNQILSVTACTNYYAWNRNYQALQHKTDVAPMGPLAYTLLWVRAMYYHLFAELVPNGGIVAIARPYFGIIMSLTAMAMVCVVLNLKQLWIRYPALKVLGLVTALYLLLLWARNYSEYLRLGEWVAVQGRYLMPVVAFIYLVLVLGVADWVRSWGARAAGYVAAPVVALLLGSFVYFGGNARYLAEVTPAHNWQTYGPTLDLPATTLAQIPLAAIVGASIVGVVYVRALAGLNRQRLNL